MKDYMNCLNLIELLSPEKEARLWNNYIDEGCQESFDKLIVSYIPFTYKIVRGILGNSFLLEECVQVGILGLIEAAKKYDPSRNIKFSTWSVFRIKGRVLNYLKRNNKQNYYDDTTLVFLETGGAESVFKGPLEPEAQVLQNEELRQIQEFLPCLPNKERAVIYGFYVEGRTPKCLSQELGVTISYVSKLLKNAHIKLKNMLGEN